MSRALVVLCASCVLFFQFFSLTYCQTFQYSRGKMRPKWYLIFKILIFFSFASGWTNGKRSLDKVEESSDESEPVAPGMILDRPSRHPRHQATKVNKNNSFYGFFLYSFAIIAVGRRSVLQVCSYTQKCFE